jgi:cell division septum initiation protein DivIVA
MHRSLDTISEDDETVRTSSTEPTEYTDLPEVTPTARTFDADTIRRQNQANQALKEKIELEQQIAHLQKQLRDKDKTSAATASNRREAERTPQRPVPTFPPDPPFSPHGLTPRVPRPQDVAYQEALKREKHQEVDQTIDEMENFKSEAGIFKMFSKLRCLHRHLPTTTTPMSPRRPTSLAKTMSGKRGIASFAPT